MRQTGHLLPEYDRNSSVFHRRQFYLSTFDAVVEVQDDRIKRWILKGERNRFAVGRLVENDERGGREIGYEIM